MRSIKDRLCGDAFYKLPEVTKRMISLITRSRQITGKSKAPTWLTKFASLNVLAVREES